MPLKQQGSCGGGTTSSFVGEEKKGQITGGAAAAPHTSHLIGHFQTQRSFYGLQKTFAAAVLREEYLQRLRTDTKNWLSFGF